MSDWRRATHGFLNPMIATPVGELRPDESGPDRGQADSEAFSRPG